MSDYIPDYLDKQNQYNEYLFQMQQKFAREQLKHENVPKTSTKLQDDLNLLTKKVQTLETKVYSHDTMIEELEFRTNLVPFEKNLNDILGYVEKDLKDLDFIVNLYYSPLEENTLEIVIIHNLPDRVKALGLVRKKLVNMRNAFPEVNFQPLLLHKDEVQPDHLMGTKQIIQK